MCYKKQHDQKEVNFQFFMQRWGKVRRSFAICSVRAFGNRILYRALTGNGKILCEYLISVNLLAVAFHMLEIATFLNRHFYGIFTLALTDCEAKADAGCGVQV